MTYILNLLLHSFQILYALTDDEPQHQRRNSFVGTAQYVSPELLTDKSVSRSSDLWALGCIIYQMVAGLPPFRSRFVIHYLVFGFFLTGYEMF